MYVSEQRQQQQQTAHKFGIEIRLVFAQNRIYRWYIPHRRPTPSRFPQVSLREVFPWIFYIIQYAGGNSRGLYMGVRVACSFLFLFFYVCEPSADIPSIWRITVISFCEWIWWKNRRLCHPPSPLSRITRREEESFVSFVWKVVWLIFSHRFSLRHRMNSF